MKEFIPYIYFEFPYQMLSTVKYDRVGHVDPVFYIMGLDYAKHYHVENKIYGHSTKPIT